MIAGPGPKKPKRKLPTIGDVMVARDQLPRGSNPRTIPYFYTKANEDVPMGERLHVASIPDPMEVVHPLPFHTAGSVHLSPGRVPEELQWQAPFLDTLTQLVGHEPGFIAAKPDIGPHSWGEFMGLDRSITLGGQILPSDYFQKHQATGVLGGTTLRVDPGEVRSSAAHEWGHLLTNQEDPILQAFINAAPTPKTLRNDPTLAGKVDFNKWPPDLIASEAFADMFASALRKQLPGMEPQGGAARTEYPFTPQFGGRSRQRMVDSLVNVLLPRLQP